MGSDLTTSIKASQIRNNTLTNDELSTTNVAVDGYILSYDEATGKFTWTEKANPAGTNTQVQFNDGGSFGGDSAFIWNKINDTLILSSSENQTRLEIDNNGTGHGVYIHQDELLASGKHGLYIWSGQDNIKANTALVKIIQDSSISSEPAFEIQNDGTGAGIEIDNNGTGYGLYLHQDGVLAEGKYGLYIYSNASQTTSYLAFIEQDNSSSTKTSLCIQNDGMGEGLYLYQNGNGNSLVVDNNGTSHGIYIHQKEVLASSKYGFYVYSNAIQVNSRLVRFQMNNALSTQDMIYGYNVGSGNALIIEQEGVLAVGAHGINATSNAVNINADTALVKIIQNNASSTEPSIEIDHDGSEAALEINSSHASSAHIRLTGDCGNATPIDGDIWFDGTNLKIRIGVTTYNLDKTAE